MGLRITKTRTTTQGADAAGASTTVNPVFVGGKDCSGNAQPLPICTTVPSDTANGVFVAGKAQKKTKDSFSSLTLDTTTNWQLVKTGTGMAISQSGGNLVITSGTTANSETLYRHRYPIAGSQFFRFIQTLSQRIVDNNFYLELVEVLGDDLPFTCSGTTVVVTKSGHGYEVGQTIDFCVPTVTGGSGTIVPGTWAITAANATTFTFTATGSSGSAMTGTCTISGWNSIYVRAQSTTATSLSFTSRRRGWGSAETTATINTTASGHYGTIQFEDGFVGFGDTTLNSSSVFSNRAARNNAVPADNVPLYLQIRARNGTTNPAGTTTWTIGMVQREEYAAFPVSVHSGKGNAVIGSPQVTVISAPTTTIAGQAAHDAAISGNPVRTGGRALTAAYTTVATGDTADYITTLQGVQIIKPWQIPELEFGVPDSITNSTTAVQIKAATASLHNYILGFNITFPTLGTAGYFMIRSASLACNSQTIAANTLVTSASSGWRIGDMIYVAASTVTGLTAGNYYYILTITTTSITFSATRGGSTLAISGTGVTATIHKVIHRHSMPTTALAPNVVMVKFPNPIPTGLNLATEAWTPVATTGQIDFNVWGYVAP